MRHQFKNKNSDKCMVCNGKGESLTIDCVGRLLSINDLDLIKAKIIDYDGVNWNKPQVKE